MKKLFAIALASIGLLSIIGLSACSGRNSGSDSNSGSENVEDGGNANESGDVEEGGDVEQNGDYSETFEGTISEETYPSTAKAAEAFLENELASDDSEIEFVSYTKTSDITDAELAGFDLGDVKAEDIQSKEWGKVSYTLTVDTGVASLSAMSASEENTRQVKVGMFQIANVYRYFVPVAGTGEMISKSYFESVFESEKYKNCSAKYEMETRLTMSVPEYGSESSVSSLIYDLNIAENAVKFEFTLSSSGLTASESTHAVAYFIPTEKGLAVYQKVDDGAWTRNYNLESQYTSLSDLYKMVLPDMIDYGYFEKTATGFKLSPDKFQSFMSSYLATNSAASALKGLDMTYDGEATYFVTEGRLSKSTIRVGVSATQNYNDTTMTVGVNASASNEFSDFGTTTVTIPAEVQALVNP